MGDKKQLRHRLADKVWNTLFGSDIPGILSPIRIRRCRHKYIDVRQAELVGIKSMMRDLDELHAGRKRLNPQGQLIDSLDDQDTLEIQLNPVIELADDELLNQVSSPDTAIALRHARQSADIQALRLTLNLRLIAIRADLLSFSIAVGQVSERPVDLEWMARWQEVASRATSPSLQEMWARVLLNEVSKPGHHSFRSLHFLTMLSNSDAAALRLLAGLDMNGSICREAQSYFLPDVHGALFKQMTELGILVNATPKKLRLSSVATDHFQTVIRCQDKALYVEGETDEVSLHVTPITALGKEILALFPARADSAYLFAIGNVLKQRGLRVEIGDWVAHNGKDGLFIEQWNL